MDATKVLAMVSSITCASTGDEPAAKKHRGGSKGKKKGANQRRREANARDR